ncbi:Putative Bacterial Ig-like domain protein [Archangium gephyra]|uniref:Bacterial Ig-like domain protein n=1 Tax=Archangium gephyra TaxID=48 RepID=A0AAC8TCL6_9BACT|nr:Putative Bacterial Ig-like domain protein [Archangium gephyra]
MFSVLLSSLALVGCGSGAEGQPDDFHDGRDPIVFPEGTSLAADGGVDGGNPYEVRGSRVMHYRLDIGDFTQPVDPYSPELRAFTLSDGGTRPLTVQTSPDGTFRVTDAPAGQYYLQLGTFYVVSDSRTMDLDRYDLGRRDRVSAPSIPVTLSASNLTPQPYEDYPSFEAISSNLGSAASLYANAPVAAGVTSVDKLPMGHYSMTTTEPQLVDVSRGDRLYVNQSTTRDAGAFSYTTIDRFFTPGPLTMSPTVSTDLSGAFQLAPQYTARFEWWRSRFEAYQVQVHPQSRPNVQWLSISPTPWTSGSWYGYSGDLMFASLSGITDLVANVTYGNPYPFSWGAVTAITHRFQVTATLLPGTTTGGLYGILSDTRPLSAATAGPIAPRVTPPWDLAVDGRGAQQALTLGSLTPRITWKAPLVGTPSAYQVRISRLAVSGTRTTPYNVATLHTTSTSVDVPPGILQVGQKYAIIVYAYLTPSASHATRPYVLESLVDIASASTVSSILSAPAALAPEALVEPEPSFELELELEPGIKSSRRYRMRE